MLRRSERDVQSSRVAMEAILRDCPHTVNSPVLESYPTWVTCTGFSGAEMVGLRGVPTKLFIKLEKPLFFFSLLLSRASSLYRCRGLLLARSPRGCISSIRLPAAAKLWESRDPGLAKAGLEPVVCECDGCDGRCVGGRLCPE